MKTDPVTRDPIIAELHRHRKQMLEEANNDPDAFFQRVKELEQRYSGRFNQGPTIVEAVPAANSAWPPVSFRA